MYSRKQIIENRLKKQTYGGPLAIYNLMERLFNSLFETKTKIIGPSICPVSVFYNYYKEC